MSSSSNSPLTLPIVSIQPSFRSVIDDVYSGQIPFEDFWLSCYRNSSPSIHAKVQVELDEIKRDQVNLAVREGDVKINSAGVHPDTKYTVSSTAMGVSNTSIIVPYQEYTDPERAHAQHPHRITAFDISPDSTQYATGYLDGSIHIYPSTSLSSPTPSGSGLTKSKHVSHPHKSTVTSLQFFPSSKVILSAGTDFALHVIPADFQSESNTGTAGTPKKIEPARTLRGHTRSITSTAIISRGRNVLSSSLDGTIRLWNVSSGEQIALLVAGRGKYTAVNAISLGGFGQSELGRRRPDGEEEGEGDEVVLANDPREVDTQDKVVFAALQDGSFEVFDLRKRRSIYHSSLSLPRSSPVSTTSPTPKVATPPNASPSGALTSISYSASTNLLATGSATGVVCLYDTRYLSTPSTPPATSSEQASNPLTSFTRNTALVTDLAFILPGGDAEGESTEEASQAVEGAVSLVIGAEDGLAYVASVRPEGPGVLGEVVGGDCDAVRAVRVRKGERGAEVWTAGDDGVVRRYGV